MVETIEIPLEAINAPEYDFRSRVDLEKLGELMVSIKNHGLIHPILVRPVEDEYEIVAGTRRYVAHMKLGLPTIRAEVRDLSDDEAEFIKLSENIQREDVTQVDESRFFVYLKEKFGLVDEDIARQVGKSRAYVTQRTGIAKWPEGLREDLERGELGWAVCLQISRLKDEEKVDYYRFYAKQQSANYVLVKYWIDTDLATPPTVQSQIPEAPTEVLSSWTPTPVRCRFCEKPAREGAPWITHPICMNCLDLVRALYDAYKQAEEEE